VQVLGTSTERGVVVAQRLKRSWTSAGDNLAQRVSICH